MTGNFVSSELYSPSAPDWLNAEHETGVSYLRKHERIKLCCAALRPYLIIYPFHYFHLQKSRK
jgi:hypothetical protein